MGATLHSSFILALSSPYATAPPHAATNPSAAVFSSDSDRPSFLHVVPSSRASPLPLRSPHVLALLARHPALAPRRATIAAGAAPVSSSSSSLIWCIASTSFLLLWTLGQSPIGSLPEVRIASPTQHLFAVMPNPRLLAHL
jgi:hypothetical protein